MFSKSKHNGMYVVISIIRLRTCFGPCAGPSSGHKIYKEEKLYSVGQKIDYIPYFMTHSVHNCLFVVIFIIRLRTCFGPCVGPSSGHKIYKEEKLYSVSQKIDYIPYFDSHCTQLSICCYLYY
jgi:hypothetical protein